MCSSKIRHNSGGERRTLSVLKDKKASEKDCFYFLKLEKQQNPLNLNVTQQCFFIPSEEQGILHHFLRKEFNIFLLEIS